MSEFYAFASNNPMLTFLLCWLVARYTFKFYRQAWRSLTIMLHGYPPMWCDADGDFPKPEKKTDS